MRRGHLDALRPLCPVCLRQGERASPVELATVVVEEAEQIVEGVLLCSHGGCQSEFPILDGMPLLVPELRRYVAANIGQIARRGDLSATLESLLGDCCGPGSPFDATRQQLSSYAWDHWADQDPETGAAAGDPGAPPGSVVELLAGALELAGELPEGPLLDLGCATGRTAFELARRTRGPVLGVDLNFALLQVAAEALRRGEVRYPRRRLGLVYDSRRHPVATPGAARVDFWVADAGALPFAAGRFAAIVGLNLLDSVASPAEAVTALSRALAAGGKLVLATPWDWSPAATPVEAWLGGHSQRCGEGGAAEPVLRRRLEEAGLEVVGERRRLPWRVRLHDRSLMEYQAHLLVARKPAPTD